MLRLYRIRKRLAAHCGLPVQELQDILIATKSIYRPMMHLWRTAGWHLDTASQGDAPRKITASDLLLEQVDLQCEALKVLSL